MSEQLMYENHQLIQDMQREMYKLKVILHTNLCQ